MSKSEQGKRIEKELRSVNSKIALLNQYKTELNLYNGQEQIFKKDIDILKYKIGMIECDLEMIKKSLELLDVVKRTIIIEYYLGKKSNDNIGFQLNLSKDAIVVHKRKALEELADLLYDYFVFWDKIGYKYPLEENKKVKPIFQYDLHDNFIRKWNSTKECAAAGFNGTYGCCNGIYKTCKGYRWSYVPLCKGDVANGL